MKRELTQHDWEKEDWKEYHRKICREAQKKRRALAAEKGLCRICGYKQPIPGKKTCKDCLDRVKKWQRENRNE